MKIGGFEIRNQRTVSEIGATLYEMEHPASGAKLLYLDRDTDNKTFMISFRTVPDDDTGVFHILEHSVLEGSEKYPLKDPFVELLKGSLNTFLNAFTFPDKTAYPVCSRNQKDFENLVSVYLDAVFHPLIYRREEIFLQEGWHFAFDGEGDPSYNGIVLNEMRGSYSSVDRLMEQELLGRLFPDNCYGFSSGGDPKHIPELTYESFLDHHRKFYHPANSIILLDGKMDLESILGVIEREGLAGFDAKDGRPAEFVRQKPIRQEMKRIPFAAAEEDGEKCYYNQGFVGGDFSERKRLMGMRILCRYLAASNESPLTKAILSAGLAEDLELVVEDGILQPFVSLVLRNIEEKNLPEAKKILDKTLRAEACGMDKKALHATVNRTEFYYKERDFDGLPQGIGFALEMLDSCQYGGDPIQNLPTDELFSELRAGIENGFFEELLRSLFLDNPHTADLLMVPEKGLTEKNAEEEKAKISARFGAMSTGKIDDLRLKFARLQKFQEELDSDVSCLPTLSLKEISREPILLPTDEKTIDGHRVLFHKAETGGITYLDLYFPVAHLNLEDISAVQFLTCLLGNLATSKKSARELQVARNALLGSLRFDTSFHQVGKDTEGCLAFLKVSAGFLTDKAAEALDLLIEILTDTQFTDRETVEIMLRQQVEGIKQFTVQSGHSYAILSARADLSARGNLMYVTMGEGYAQWLNASAKSTDGLTEKMKAVFASVFDRSGLIFSRTSDCRNDEEERRILQALPAGKPKEQFFRRVSGLGKKHISIPAPVSYAGMSANLFNVGKRPTGEIAVLAKMLSLDYLWQEVRVKGGAYGAGMIVASDGNVALYSYRDPDAKKTLGVFAKLPETAEKLLRDTKDLTRLIIGSIAATEPLLLPKEIGARADGRIFAGMTDDDLRRERNEILDATPEKLAAVCPVLKELFKTAGECVVTNQK